MKSTTVDDKAVVANENRTEGRIKFLKSTHIMIPLIGSGAVYTNLHDFVHYAQFHLNGGSWMGNQLIKKESLKMMYVIHRNSYGLGIHVGMDIGDYYIDHGGGGYGYTSILLLYPEYKVGAVILCNGDSNSFSTCQRIIREYVRRESIAKDDSISTLFHHLNSAYFENPQSFNQRNESVCEGTIEYQKEWGLYEGTYAPQFPGYNLTWFTKLVTSLGYRPIKFTVEKKGSNLVMTGWNDEKTLREYGDGLFFTQNGEVLDLKTDPPTFRNILLEKKKGEKLN
jgi:hypothetical protein